MKWLSLKYAEKQSDEVMAVANANLKAENAELKRKLENEKSNNHAVAKASAKMSDKLFDLGWTVCDDTETGEIVICETVNDDDEPMIGAAGDAEN